jgi:hypothetical protein
VLGLSDVAQVAGDCARTRAGAVLCARPDGSGLRRVALGEAARGLASGIKHACALLEAGDVSCWGDDAYGQLGEGEAGAGSPDPVRVRW